MIVVLDVNIVLSALMKDSITRELIVKSGLDFCFPEVSLEKIQKYKSLILEKSDLSDIEFSNLCSTLFSFIRLISNAELKMFWSAAMEIIGSVDVEDVPFIAIALSQNAAIWSEDKHFEKQDKVLILKTKDIINLVDEK